MSIVTTNLIENEEEIPFSDLETALSVLKKIEPELNTAWTRKNFLEVIDYLAVQISYRKVAKLITELPDENLL